MWANFQVVPLCKYSQKWCWWKQSDIPLHAFHVYFHSSRWDKTLLRVSFAKAGSPEQASIGSFLMDFRGTLHRFNHRCWMLTNLYHIWLVVWNPGILWLSSDLGMECYHPKWVRLTQGSCKGFGSYTGWFGTFFIFHFIQKGCHPPTIDEVHHFSRWAHCTTNQIYYSLDQVLITNNHY